MTPEQTEELIDLNRQMVQLLVNQQTQLIHNNATFTERLQHLETQRIQAGPPNFFIPYTSAPGGVGAVANAYLLTRDLTLTDFVITSDVVGSALDLEFVSGGDTYVIYSGNVTRDTGFFLAYGDEGLGMTVGDLIQVRQVLAPNLVARGVLCFREGSNRTATNRVVKL